MHCAATAAGRASESVELDNDHLRQQRHGDGTVTYSVSANTETSSRSATITVAGKSHTVTQNPAPPPQPPPSIPYVFNYNFEGTNTSVTYHNPLNSVFDTYVGKPFYGIVHLDTSKYEFDDGISAYWRTEDYQDQYVEFWLEEMYFKVFIPVLDYHNETGFGFFSEYYDENTFQLPEYLEGHYMDMDGFYFDFDSSTGSVGWSLYGPLVPDPYFDYIYGNGPIESAEPIAYSQAAVEP